MNDAIGNSHDSTQLICKSMLGLRHKITNNCQGRLMDQEDLTTSVACFGSMGNKHAHATEVETS